MDSGIGYRMILLGLQATATGLGIFAEVQQRHPEIIPERDIRFEFERVRLL